MKLLLRKQLLCLQQHVQYKRSFVFSACRSLYDSNSKARTKRIVVILPWLGAPPSAVKKYEDIYSKRGFESMVYHAGLRDFLWPKSGLQSSLQILEEVREKVQQTGENNAAHIVIHSFSVGCYIYALMLWQMRENPEQYCVVSDNIKAQVSDSPVVGTLNEMAIGVGKMISPKSDVLAKVYQSICLGYFAVTKSQTVYLYDEFISTFKHHAPKVPSIIVASENDPMQGRVAFKDLCTSWNNKQLVFHKVWADSLHAQHLRFHPLEYEALVDKMLAASSVE